MNAFDGLPPWAALAAAILVLTGAGLALLGSIGLLRLRNFYQRVHAPTLGTTLGVYCTLLSSILVSWAPDGRPILYEILIGVFLTLTAPVTLMLLVRAALYRDREEGAPNVPPAPRGE